MSGFHGAFATGVASQQGTLTLPDTWFRPQFWDLLMLQLLRPNSSNLPCLYSTFHLEYPLVLSRFYYLPNWTLLPILTLLPKFWGFHRTLQLVRLANRGRLLLRTPGPVPFGTCICSNVETILSWNCRVYGPFEFRTSLGTSILPLRSLAKVMRQILNYTCECNSEQTLWCILIKCCIYVAYDGWVNSINVKGHG